MKRLVIGALGAIASVPPVTCGRAVADEAAIEPSITP